MESSQQNFMNQIAAGKLGIEQGQLSLASQRLSFDRQKSLAELELEYQKTNDPLRREELQASIDYKRAQTGAILSKDSTTKYAGISGTEKYLNDQGMPTVAVQHLMNLFDKELTAYDNTLQKPLSQTEVLRNALANAQKAGYSPEILTKFRNAILAYYGKL
jgi:hypothetical protein